MDEEVGTPSNRSSFKSMKSSTNLDSKKYKVHLTPENSLDSDSSSSSSSSSSNSESDKNDVFGTNGN